MSATNYSESTVDCTEWGTSTAAGSVLTPIGTVYAYNSEYPSKTSNINPVAVHPRSKVAAGSFQDVQGRHLCVYWQDEKGMIRESLFVRNKEWSFLRSVFVSDRAKHESPLSVIVWANGVERRLYYLDNSNLIREYTIRAICMDGFSWSEEGSGLTALKVATHAQSGLTSGHLGEKGLSLRVFYQDNTSQLQELKFDPQCPWSHGYRKLPYALPGSTLAFGAHPEVGSLFLYYQTCGGQPAEIVYLNSFWLNPLFIWNHGGYRPHGQYQLGTGIACIVRLGHLRIFAHRGDGLISDTIWAPIFWQPTKDLPIAIANVTQFVAMEWKEQLVHKHSDWQQHLIGINSKDGEFWDYITGSEKVETQKLFL